MFGKLSPCDAHLWRQPLWAWGLPISSPIELELFSSRSRSLRIIISITFVRKRSPYPYKQFFILLSNHPLLGPSIDTLPLSNRCGISQSTPFQGSASSLTHRLVPSYDIVCFSPLCSVIDSRCSRLDHARYVSSSESRF